MRSKTAFYERSPIPDNCSGSVPLPPLVQDLAELLAEIAARKLTPLPSDAQESGRNEKI